MPPLSAVVTTLNAASTLDAVLTALAWCDEILVVDSGSTDATLEICRRHGCRLIQHDFAGFGRQKHFAVNCARHDWVFVVDSDEVVTDELRAEILARLSGDGLTEAGFEMAISLVFLGRLLRFGGEYGKLHLRLFDRRAGNYNFDEVHERVNVAGRVGKLRGRMLHYSYRNLAQYFEKFNHYTSSSAEQSRLRGKRTAAWKIVLRLPLDFVRLYLVRGLILDGYPGFAWALLSSLYSTVKYMKLLELQQSRQSHTLSTARVDRAEPTPCPGPAPRATNSSDAVAR